MAFVRKESNSIHTGDTVEAIRQIDGDDGYFEKGTLLRVTNISPKGYDLEDEDGNIIKETGWSKVKKII